MQIDFFNPRSIIVFICILQGLIFAGLIIVRGLRQKSQADFWLAGLLLLLCISLMTPFIGFANVYDLHQWLTYFPFSLAYTTGVFVYFYVQSLTNAQRQFTRRDFLLLLPAIIYLLFRLVLFAQSLAFKGWFDKNYYVPVVGPLVVVTEFGWNVLFLYLALRHYKKYRAWLDENYSDTEKIKFDWLRNFLYVFTVVLILGALFDFTNSFIFRLRYVQYFYFEFILALIVYGVSIAGYLRSETIELRFTPEPVAPEPATEPRKIVAEGEELASLKTKLQNLMATDKPYLDPQLTLSDLAKQMGVNTSTLSYVINNGFAKNFNDFINEFRIAEVKAKLQTDEAKHLTLLAIAFDCGFNSKATFNRAFKKFTGVSPREFQAQNSAS